MQFETLRIFNSLLTSAFQGIHNWVQAINISLNTSGAILELLTLWRSDCVIYPLLLSCMVADLKSKYGLLVEFWYSISHRWIGDHEKQYMIWLSWLICGDVLIVVLDRCSQVEAAGSSTFFRRQKTRRWRREEGRCSLARLLLNSLALLLLNHVHQLQVGDQVGSVQWTRDGLTLGYDRDLPGFDRYYVLGNDEAGTYNLQVCISNKLCQHDLK